MRLALYCCMEMQDTTVNLHELNEAPFRLLGALNGSYLQITANVSVIFFVAHTAPNFLLIFMYTVFNLKVDR